MLMDFMEERLCCVCSFVNKITINDIKLLCVFFNFICDRRSFLSLFQIDNLMQLKFYKNAYNNIFSKKHNFEIG